MANSLEKYQCDGARRHVWLENGRPKACERYLDEFCHVMLEVIKKETKDTMNAEKTKARRIWVLEKARQQGMRH